MNRELRDALAKVTGPEGLLEGPDVAGRASGIWDPRGIQADLILRPRTTEEVAAILKLCHAAAQPVVVHGGLTGLVHGADTRPGEVVLSTERMNRIEQVDVAGRTMTVQAGCILQHIQQAAAEAGMEFALDLGARGSCAIGGNVSTNAGGTQVIRYGMAREQVLGLEAVLADGTALTSLNHMLKNNAGYDLKHLFIGTEGTLGVVTRLVLRLREAPRSTQTALLAAESLQQVTALLKHADAGLGGSLSSFEVMWQEFYALVSAPATGNAQPLPPGHAYYVLLEAQGADPTADSARFQRVLEEAFEAGLTSDAVVAGSGRERDALWALRDGVEHTLDFGPAITFDVSLRIADMEAYVAEVRTRVAKEFAEHHCWVFGHLGDGNLHIVVATGDAEPATRARVETAVYEPLRRINGSVSAEHGIGLEKRAWLPLSRSPAELALMRTLKDALDPRGILNPGKVLPAEA